MKVIGSLLALAGWLVPVMGLAVSTSDGVRMVLCAVGMTSCLVGILGFTEGAYIKNPIWKK